MAEEIAKSLEDHLVDGLSFKPTIHPTSSAVIPALTSDAGVDINSKLSVSKITTNRTDETLTMHSEENVL